MITLGMSNCILNSYCSFDMSLNILLGGKSSILMEVKPWDDETDMKKLEECVRSVDMPGLLWGACKSIISILSTLPKTKRVSIELFVKDGFLIESFLLENCCSKTGTSWLRD